MASRHIPQFSSLQNALLYGNSAIHRCANPSFLEESVEKIILEGEL